MQTPSAPSPVRILGIDPGSRITGYGVIELAGLVPRYVASGCIRTADGALEQRLAQIYAGLSEVVGLHRPNAVAIERVFMAKNPDSALKLGQARGAALVCMANHGLAIEEYAARQIKQAVTGQGRRRQVAGTAYGHGHLAACGRPQADAADALAIALTHAYASQSPQALSTRGRASSLLRPLATFLTAS